MLGWRRSGTDKGFNWGLRWGKDGWGSEAEGGLWALVARGGAVDLVGVLGPPILESSCLS